MIFALDTLRSLRQVAAEMGRPVHAVRRILRRAYGRDVASGVVPDWREWDGREGSKMRFNMSRLRAAHPELFVRRHVARAELEELQSRVESIASSSRMALIALRARVRTLENRAAHAPKP